MNCEGATIERSIAEVARTFGGTATLAVALFTRLAFAVKRDAVGSTRSSGVLGEGAGLSRVRLAMQAR